jgi:3-hydroxybutyryl-CoA dehydratase
MTTAAMPFEEFAASDFTSVSFSKRRTVGEFDILSFAGITGDLAANHTDEMYMRANGFPGRIAHGVLVLGYTSALSTEVADRIAEPVVSLGYDRVRFTKPVPIGTTFEGTYTVREVDIESRRVISDAVVKDVATGDTLLVATHVMKVM